VGMAPAYSSYLRRFLKSNVGRRCGIPVENAKNL
jgi:hypothetical protein